MAATDTSSWSPSLDQLLDKISGNRWLPLAANIGALVLLVYGLAQWTWHLLQPPAAPSTAARVVQPVLAPPDLQPLLSGNLFGRLPDTKTGAVDPGRLPISSLNLVLTGVMARGSLSFALFSIGGQPEMPVFVGQEVTAGAILEAVYPDRAVLRRGGTLESVVLKDSDAVLPAGSIVPVMRTEEPVTALNAVKPMGSGTYNIDRRALTQGMTAETLNQASVAPSANGLVVREVQGGSVFEKLGLRSGDTVRSINGQQVTSLEDIVKVYAQFNAAPPSGPVMVEVTRGGKNEVLQYQMQ